MHDNSWAWLSTGVGEHQRQAIYASWESRHSRHCYRFPRQQYVKVGAVLRQFRYTVAALYGCLRRRRHCAPEILFDHLHEALQDLNTAIKSQPCGHCSCTCRLLLEFLEALPFAAFASFLVEIGARLDNVIEEVEELGEDSLLQGIQSR
ncbi:hypothetical protein V6N13_138360 [Hibiscus sabdariffa]